MNYAKEQPAIFSDCRRYRYTLWRRWSEGGVMQVIGLNPSTADETKDDPTIRRCIGFAKQWGYGALCMTNLFAFRATNPEDMKKEGDPVGYGNDQALLQVATIAEIVILAYGRHGKHQGRDKEVIASLGKMWPKIKVMGLNEDRTPKHPLYLPKSTIPEAFYDL